MPLKSHPDEVNKSALVTGAGIRIGAEVVKHLAGRGFAVAIHAHTSIKEAEKIAAEITAAGGIAVALDGDLSEPGVPENLVGRANEALTDKGAKPLGLLYNNACPFKMETWDTVTRESWDLHIEAGLRAPFLLAQAFGKSLEEEAGGLIINMLDQRVWNLTPFFISYTIAKAGLWTLNRTLALGMGPQVRVNGIGPGYIWHARGQDPKEYIAHNLRMPLGRSADMHDLMAAIDFIIAARSMTGAMIPLDGGEHLGYAMPRETLAMYE